MKSFVGGIVGAVVAGLLLFFAQNWWAQGQADARQRISFDKRSDFNISRAELSELARKGNDYQTPSIQVIEVENAGTEDISEKSFSAATSDILGFSSISSPNGNPKNATISYDGKIISVKYRLLPAKSKHVFWIATTSYSVGPEFSNDSTGVHVVNASEKIEAQLTPFPWGWVGAIAACAITLLLGIVIGETTAADMLSKRGFDYRAIIKRPLATPQPSETPETPPSP